MIVFASAAFFVPALVHRFLRFMTAAILGIAASVAASEFVTTGLATATGLVTFVGVMAWPRRTKQPTREQLSANPWTGSASDAARNLAAPRRWRWSARVPDDARIEATWQLLERYLADAGSRVAVARSTCERFLAAQAGDQLDPSGIDLRIDICGNLPTMIATMLDGWDSSTPDERQRRAARALASIEATTADAERWLAAHASAGETAFDREADHLARKSSERSRLK